MAARIEHLEQRLAAMVDPGASTSTPDEEEDFSYLASASEVEVLVVVTRDGARTSEPCQATVELDPQRGEGGRQARLLQSFLLSEAALARMESLPARPAIDCERIVPRVCMMDNRSGLFCLIKTSLSGTSDRSYFMRRQRISVQLRHDYPRDSLQFEVRAVVASVESYDVLVGGAVLYPIGFRMNYWMETATYRLGFSGVLTWPNDLLEGNMSAEDTPVHEDVEEVVSFAGAVSSSLDVSLCSSCHALQHEADRDGGPGLVWDTRMKQLVEPNADKREHAMEFSIGITKTPSISEALRRQN
ncbi:hypothetical protein AXG93_4525s1050 [Marchantia polymorpha subsp. ruderalis]|uniref:Uncharacterized protein n=1 Tax=Marchantia polymorpha subsp. ruderalis TaxID=1480154 RepID=A0A176WH57_MARPO|nr:hypothetical protein AXG93_4525s1050 [Marchantia polymorpha subsp. ruderalis]